MNDDTYFTAAFDLWLEAVVRMDDHHRRWAEAFLNDGFAKPWRRTELLDIVRAALDDGGYTQV